VNVGGRVVKMERLRQVFEEAGFTGVYHTIDGFEGDKVAEEGSVYLGKRMKNGWKNSGAPWTYDGNPDLLWIAKG